MIFIGIIIGAIIIAAAIIMVSNQRRTEWFSQLSDDKKADFLYEQSDILINDIIAKENYQGGRVKLLTSLAVYIKDGVTDEAVKKASKELRISKDSIVRILEIVHKNSSISD